MTVVFTPSASTSVNPDAIAGTFPMPPVDGSNVDVTVQNTSPGMAWVAFAPGTGVGPSVSTCLKVPSGAQVLLTANPAVLAASSTNPLVQTLQGGAYATATTFTVMTQQRGGALVVTRGTAAAAVVF